jgi:two-component system OmpR family response regulator
MSIMQAGTIFSAGDMEMSALPENRTRVLVVDNDSHLREMLARFLSEHGLVVIQTRGGEEFLAILERDLCDIVVLDRMLPGEGGISLCRKARAASTIPIILLSAAGDENDRIVGLEVGADDCLAKPFNPRELLARIRAILRRMALAADPASHPSCYRFEGWAMDMKHRTLSDPVGTWIELTSSEFDLLAVFVQRPRIVLSRDHLLDLVHGRSSSQLDRSIDVQISRLRRKIEADAQSPCFIRTMRNEGYIFAADVEKTGL